MKDNVDLSNYPSPHYIKKGMATVMGIKKQGPWKLLELEREYGDFINFKAAGKNMFLISDPEHIKHILKNKDSTFVKSSSSKKLKGLLGEGLLTAEGETWRQNRKIVAPCFSKNYFIDTVKVITDTIHERLEKWSKFSPDSAFDVQTEMMELTLSVTSRSFFRSDIGDDFTVLKDSFDIALGTIVKRLHRLFNIPLFVPTPSNVAFNKSIRNLNRIVGGIIESRRSSEKKNDLLDLLMSSEEVETGKRLSDSQLKDELLTMLLGGYDTSANSLTWAWCLLSKNPAIADKVFAEVDLVLKGKTPTYGDLENLPYCRSVFTETLRLYPPVWVLAREAREADVFKERVLPKGSMILMSPYVVHHKPEIWENAEGFRPERFEIDERLHKSKFNFFPFGGGQRQCLGMRFAMMEATLIIAMVSQKFRLELASCNKLQMSPSITLGIKDGMKMYVKNR